MTTTTQTNTTEYMVSLPITTYAVVSFNGPEGLTPDQVSEYLNSNKYEPITGIETNNSLKREVAEALHTQEYDLRKYSEEEEDYLLFDTETNTWENY